jgi:dipeptidyl aminopeptidase/acylaminoacyl peptidase
VSRDGSFRWLNKGAGGRDLSWAPDGLRLAVTTQTSAQPAITVYEAARTDGIGVRIADGWDAAWSPDGAAIAFTHWHDGLHVVAPDGKSDRRVAAGARPSWSPDSKQLAYERSGSVYVANPDGSEETLLTRGERPVWSPDGSWIGVERDESAVAVRADRTSERMLGRGRIVSWSPDASEALLLETAGGVVRAASLRTGTVRRIAEDAVAAAAAPQWDRVATVLVVGRQSEIYFADISGAQPRRVTPSQCEQYSADCFEGTDRADRIMGTSERDVIFPGAGDDRVWGRGGHDRIDTAYGRDVVVAGPGNDIVLTHGNDDRLDGGLGIDHLVPGNGEDIVNGGSGRDWIVVYGDERVDHVRCGPGLDTVLADPVDKVARDCEGVKFPSS